MNMDQLEALTATYSRAYDALAYFVADTQAEIRKLKRLRRERFKRLIQDAANSKASLAVALQDSKALFDRPKTRVLHGVKIGFRKGKGKLTWGDDAQVIKRIRSLYTDESGVLITVIERPNRDALEKLPEPDLMRLGISIEDAGDQVVIKPAAGDIDRLVDALLADDGDEIQEAAA